MKKSKLKLALEVEYFNAQQVFKYNLEYYGKDHYKTAYARGYMSGIEEALSEIEGEENEENLYDQA